MPMTRLVNFLFLLVIQLPAVSWAFGQQTFFVSPNGNDEADGLTAASAWRSVERVNASSFQPGDTVLFERGAVWDASLQVTTSGTVTQPITFGAYGQGAAPLFRGSDLYANQQFTHVTGSSSTYQLTAAQPVSSVFRDGQFLRSAHVLTGHSTNPAAVLAKVNSTPNSWAQLGNTLYVNTNGVDPGSSNAEFRGTHRTEAITVYRQSHIVIQDLQTTDTAHWNGGYGVGVYGSENVTIRGVAATNAGKHHVGVINSTGFVGDGLYATSAMPDLAYGAATAFVAYSDHTRQGDTSIWKNSVVENLNGPYPAFYNHGPGIGSVHVENLVAHQAEIILVNETGQQQLSLLGGGVTDSKIIINGNNALIDGVTIHGRQAGLTLNGHGNVVQNSQLYVGDPTANYKSYILNNGSNNIYQFNSIVADSAQWPSWWGDSNVLALLGDNQNVVFRGNIVLGTANIVTSAMTSSHSLDMQFNLYGDPNSRFWYEGQWWSFSDWQASGRDLSTLLDQALLQDPAAGDFRLVWGSAGVDAIPADLASTWGVWRDAAGNLRFAGSGFDIGAREFGAIPEVGTATLIMTIGLMGGCAVIWRRKFRNGKADHSVSG